VVATGLVESITFVGRSRGHHPAVARGTFSLERHRVELTRESIFAQQDLPVREVKIPEWGGSLYVRRLSGDERDAYEAASRATPGVHVRAGLVAATACDSSGTPLFSQSDVAAIGAKSGTALDRIFAAAAVHNRITPADIEELIRTS
jgi:hypothetical protein